jgi:hypothetical protein
MVISSARPFICIALPASLEAEAEQIAGVGGLHGAVGLG